MKLKNKIRWADSAAHHRFERGIALVITLILLSVTLVMAVAFLAISRRERGAVTTSTDTITARYAADAALANAQAQIIASILAGNPYNSGLIVSTNFINANGFVSGAGDDYPANVNYNYANGNPLNTADAEQNIANLLYLPRAPVFVVTNRQTGASEFRFYLDLNRNGQFEANGLLPVISSDPSQPYYNLTGGTMPNIVNGNTLSNSMTGDPEWVGVLERPDVTHGPNNKFISRYAFVAVPAGGALDLNAIYNQAATKNLYPAVNTPDGYFRNQGVGSWEINLAAFLADLNTNQWDPPTVENSFMEPYQYPATVGSSVAFEDARALLAYRYANNYNSLAFASALFPNNSLADGPVDIFPFGPTMVNTATHSYSFNLNNSWPGADNTNHFFSLASDLFDPNKSSTNFVQRLTNADNGISTYDRYTFYRLLSQLGTDSAPEQNKINLNYSNAAAFYNNNGILTSVAIYPNAETNLVPWQPLQFFTIAADRMLKQYSDSWFRADPTNYLITYYGITPTWPVYANGFGVTNVSVFNRGTNLVPSFGITNIPVLMNGQFAYTPAVQRILQLAANLYDATTNQSAYLGKDYPSVFRPILYTYVSGFVTNTVIEGYQYISSVNPGSAYENPPIDPPDLSLGDINSLKTGFTPYAPTSTTVTYGNVWGVPWIIGAKKGFPNFNEFSMQDVMKVTRKLQITRPSTNSLPTGTNQLYIFSITNSFGFEFWNSYTNAFNTNSPNNIQIVLNDLLTMRVVLTNGTYVGGAVFQSGTSGFQSIVTNISVWPGRGFIIPFYTNLAFIFDSAFYYGNPSPPYLPKNPGFYYVGNNPNPTFLPTTPNRLQPLTDLLLQVTNHLQAFILDGNHVIDYVQFTGPGSSRDLNSEFQNTNTTVNGGGSAPYYTNLVWSTALNNGGVPLGIDTQIGISEGTHGLNNIYWNDPNVRVEIDSFRYFLNQTNKSLYGTATNNFLYSTNLSVQVPYSPIAASYEYDTFQANDPLVHYLKSDLAYFGLDPNANVQTGVNPVVVNANGLALTLLPNLGKVNARYQPWGVAPPTGQTGVSTLTYDENAYNFAFKDPLMTRSDNWDFPNYKLPTVGWLGRVHRGTPWQTVYLKASDILLDAINVGQVTHNIGTNTWSIWTGDANNFDAVNAAPIQDRLLFDNFTTALNDNATRGQLSVNVAANPTDPAAGLAAWSALMSGVVALTNATTLPKFQPLTNNALIISPAGMAGNNSVLGQIVTNINYARLNYVNNDGLKGVFEHAGDVLSTFQFTEQSPFLNWNNASQQQYGISDEVYEWLPQQLMSLLRVSGSPQAPTRYVIYSYGQTLQPAPNGVVTGGGFFGMVTNYQVTAETATRAVVEVNQVITTDATGYHTNYNTKIEQFNLLPPD
jgi:hypothetical protein